MANQIHPEICQLSRRSMNQELNQRTPAKNTNKDIARVKSNNNLIWKLDMGKSAFFIGFIMVLLTPSPGGVLSYTAVSSYYFVRSIKQ